MIAYLRTLRCFSCDVRLYLIVTLLGFTVPGGITAVVLDFYLLRLGCGPRTVGLVNSVGPLLLALFSLPAAEVGERLAPAIPSSWD
jgi:putative effector of murein hydrolase LrgA (UPF0299 family)